MGEPELHAQERVAQAHGDRCAGVCGNIQKREGRGLHRGFGALYEGPVPGEGEPRRRSVQDDWREREREEELGLGSKEWGEVLQLVYECNGVVSAIPHVCGDVFIGADRGTASHEPVGGMLDI
jgi:hypothetical protein